MAFAASLGKAPIVSDTDAGYAGLLAPVALVGMASAVGMEAFTDYERHAQPATVTLPEPSAP